ncbi:MAG: endolytic transglycosylase MltG [Candidatus Poribacteria bacterium]
MASILLFSGLIISGIFLISIYFGPIGDTAEEKIISITAGMDSHKIAQLLAEEKLIKSQSAFLMLARLNSSGRRLKAGQYKLNTKLSVAQILRKLVNGEVIKRRLLIPEGFTIAQIAQLWEEKGLGKAPDFERAARGANLLQKYHITASPLTKGGKGVFSLEGYLFPDTYEVTYNTTAEMFIERMLQEFNRNFTEELRQEADDLGLSVHEAVTLASIIEKEAKVDYERPIISAVFHNRLRKGWKLEADPTVLYALGNPMRNLTYDDLKINSPYNTYIHKGLPPGPICNPGIASIIAAVRPDQKPYMYFVAMGNGTHYFSKTLNEHRNAKSLAKRHSNL